MAGTDTLSPCSTTEQPFKIPFVAAVVLCANEKNGHITSDVLDLLAQKAQNAVKEGAWRSFKLILRFMACLQDVLEGEGVYPILDDLFGQAVDLQTASSDDVSLAISVISATHICAIILTIVVLTTQALGLELVKIILLTIPYCLVASSANNANEEKLAGLRQRALDLLEKTDIVASTPHTHETLVEPYLSLNGKKGDGDSDSESDERPFPAQSELNLLQKQLQSEAAEGWRFACIPRVYNKTGASANTTLAKDGDDNDMSENKIDKDTDAVNGAEEEQVVAKHVLPTIGISSPVNPGPLALFPVAYFSLYADQDVEVCIWPSSVFTC